MKLRNKFFLVLVGVPTIAVVILLFVSVQVFVEDKKLFIFESQLENAHLTAQQILLDIHSKSGDKQSLKQLDVFKSTNYTEKFLVNEKGEIVATSVPQKTNAEFKMENFFSQSTVEKLTDLSINEGSFEDKTIAQEPAMFSFIRIPEEKMVLILQTPKTSALRASTIFVLKGLVTLIGLVLSSTLASLLLSKSMTQNLTQLESSMCSFGEGHLDTQIQVRSRDEIGKLGEYFNRMVHQIKNLMLEQQEKLKLEFEMGMASQLQAKFFPPKEFSSPAIDFAGFYQPSSQCGGDWWYYFTKGDYFVAFMGDVTGHGVKSALMTAASRSIFALIEENFTDTANAMNILNRSFFAAAAGDVNMSGLIISININTGELEYTNASHDPSVVFKLQEASPDTVKAKKLQTNFLDESHGIRLGSLENTRYKKSSLKLCEGEIIFCYTDGLTEMTNSDGRIFNDRILIKSLADIDPKLFQTLSVAQSEFQQKVTTFAGGLSDLKDDLSYFFVRYKANAVIQRGSNAS